MLRKLLLKVHLYIGLVAASFLFILSLSGAVLTFDQDYDRWLHPSLWYVSPHGQRMSRQSLVDRVELQFKPARVTNFITSRDDRAYVFVMSDRSLVFVDQYIGAILGRRIHPTKIDSFVSWVHSLHTHLVHLSVGATDVGEWLVDIATIEMMVLIPTGLSLWWRRKKLSVSWKTSRIRSNRDMHSVLGIYSGVVLLIISVSGFFIAFDQPLFWATQSSPQQGKPKPHSELSMSGPTHGGSLAARLNLDDVVRIADTAFPGAPTTRVDFPLGPSGTYVVNKQLPQWVAGKVATQVYIDRYTCKVLRVDDARDATSGYRARNIMVALHTGAILGLPSKILMSVSSLLLSFLAVTGLVIGWPKLSWGHTIVRVIRIQLNRRRTDQPEWKKNKEKVPFQ
jgi:uncharacterized iron-regulated membrane protein